MKAVKESINEENKRKELEVLEAIKRDEKEWKEHPEKFLVGEDFWKAWNRI